MKINRVYDIIPSLPLLGMRLSRQSIPKSDLCCDMLYWDEIHEDDLELIYKLVKAGDEHSKVLRTFNIYVDLEAPIKWWKHLDTYKFITSLSSSTMYNLTKDMLNEKNFSYIDDEILDKLNIIINLYNRAKDKSIRHQLFDQLTSLLPQSYLQRRVIVLNYSTMLNILKQRHRHKLKEWKIFIQNIVENCGLLNHIIANNVTLSGYYSKAKGEPQC